MGNMDESPIIEIGNNYISIEEKDKLKDRYKQVKEEMKAGNKNQKNRCTKLRCYCVKLIEEGRNDCLEYKEVISEMKTLKCLVDNLEEELEIPAAANRINELETEQKPK
ncbi:34232_t:CDS:1 [Gigaspora margarita]|uniref:34232_t:CDS:1 n=1 Tax=Gigaspora margarita TaxID=4874 RepID=A0ABN7VJU6_GIGMA|nr:34232_t:CDS:1 [Gigaspora margarita]